MTLKVEKFEELLAGELQRALEPQRGKALAAFRAQCAEEAQRPIVAGTIRPGRDISRGETWFWASVPSLAAACLAVVVTLKLLGAGATTGSPHPGTNAVAGNGGTRVIISPLVEQSEQFREDGGTLAHETQYQWIDPNENSKYRLTSDEQIVPVKAPF